MGPLSKLILSSWLSFAIGFFGGWYFNDDPAPKEIKFFTDANGCQYFKKSEQPRFNPNGTQVCKKL